MPKNSLTGWAIGMDFDGLLHLPVFVVSDSARAESLFPDRAGYVYEEEKLLGCLPLQSLIIPFFSMLVEDGAIVLNVSQRILAAGDPVAKSLLQKQQAMLDKAFGGARTFLTEADRETLASAVAEKVQYKITLSDFDPLLEKLRQLQSTQSIDSNSEIANLWKSFGFKERDYRHYCQEIRRYIKDKKSNKEIFDTISPSFPVYLCQQSKNLILESVADIFKPDNILFLDDSKEIISAATRLSKELTTPAIHCLHADPFVNDHNQITADTARSQLPKYTEHLMKMAETLYGNKDQALERIRKSNLPEHVKTLFLHHPYWVSKQSSVTTAITAWQKKDNCIREAALLAKDHFQEFEAIRLALIAYFPKANGVIEDADYILFYLENVRLGHLTELFLKEKNEQQQQYWLDCLVESFDMLGRVPQPEEKTGAFHFPDREVRFKRIFKELYENDEKKAYRLLTDPYFATQFKDSQIELLVPLRLLDNREVISFLASEVRPSILSECLKNQIMNLDDGDNFFYQLKLVMASLLRESHANITIARNTAFQLLATAAKMRHNIPKAIFEYCNAVYRAMGSSDEAMFRFFIQQFLVPIIKTPEYKDFPVACHQVQKENLSFCVGALLAAPGCLSQNDHQLKAISEHLILMLKTPYQQQTSVASQLSGNVNVIAYLNQRLYMPGMAAVEIISVRKKVVGPAQNQAVTGDIELGYVDFPSEVMVLKITDFQGNSSYVAKSAPDSGEADVCFPAAHPVLSFTKTNNQISVQCHVKNVLFLPETPCSYNMQRSAEQAPLVVDGAGTSVGFSKQRIAFLVQKIQEKSDAAGQNVYSDAAQSLGLYGLSLTLFEQWETLKTDYNARLKKYELRLASQLSSTDKHDRENIRHILALLKGCEKIVSVASKTTFFKWQELTFGVIAMVAGVMGLVAKQIDTVDPSPFDTAFYTDLVPLLAKNIDLGKTAAAMGLGGILSTILSISYGLIHELKQYYQKKKTVASAKIPGNDQNPLLSAKHELMTYQSGLKGPLANYSPEVFDEVDSLLSRLLAVCKAANLTSSLLNGDTYFIKALALPTRFYASVERAFEMANERQQREIRRSQFQKGAGILKSLGHIVAMIFALIQLVRAFDVPENGQLDDFGQAADRWGNIGSDILDDAAIMLIIIGVTTIISSTINFVFDRGVLFSNENKEHAAGTIGYFARNRGDQAAEFGGGNTLHQPLIENRN